MQSFDLTLLQQLSPASLAIFKGYLLTLIHPHTQTAYAWLPRWQPRNWQAPIILGDRRTVIILGSPRRRTSDK